MFHHSLTQHFECKIGFVFDVFATSVLGICDENKNQFILHCWRYSRSTKKKKKGDSSLLIDDPVQLWRTNLDIHHSVVSGTVDAVKNSSNTKQAFAHGRDLLGNFFVYKDSNETEGEDEGKETDFLSIVITRNWNEFGTVEKSLRNKSFQETAKDSSSKLATMTLRLAHIYKIIQTTMMDKQGGIFMASIPVLDFDVFTKHMCGKQESEETLPLGFLNLVFLVVRKNDVHSLGHFPKQFYCYLFYNARQLLFNYVDKQLLGSSSSFSSPQFENAALMLGHLSHHVIKEEEEENDSYYYWFEDCAENLFKDYYIVNNITSKELYSLIKNMFLSFFLQKEEHGKEEEEVITTMTEPKQDKKNVNDILAIVTTILWSINTMICTNWYKLNAITDNYIRERKRVIKKDGVLLFQYSKYLQLTFHPDVIGLKSFNRFYWTYENLKIPYPHLTKIFVSPIYSISNPFFRSRSSSVPVYPLLENDDDDDEKMVVSMFTKMISQSCWKYGLSENQYCDNIKSAFLLLAPKSTDNTGDSPVPLEISNYWLSKTSFGHFMLLQCIRIMADFLFSLSCSLYYKMDRRIVRSSVDNNNSSSSNSKGSSKCKFFGKFIDIDSLDFEGFLGVSQDADCDEVGLYIDVVYSKVLGLKDDVEGHYLPESLKCTKFLLQNYTDFCTFSVVDSAQFEETPEEGEGGGGETDYHSQKLSALSKTSPNLLYNEYDLKSDCNTGHTSVIFWPTIHVDCAIEQCDNLYSQDGAIARTFLQDKNKNSSPLRAEIRTLFRKKYYCRLFGELVGNNMPNFTVNVKKKDEAMKRSNYFTNLLLYIFPRIPLEGTAAQDALSMYLSHYYMYREEEEEGGGGEYSKRFEKAKALINLHANTKKIQNCLVQLDILVHKFLIANGAFGKTQKRGNNRLVLFLSECEYCDYQSLKDFESSYFKGEYQHQNGQYPLEKRVVSFYRRPSQSTSQMMRYIFGDISADAFTWVNISNMTWGPPMRHVLESFPRKKMMMIRESSPSRLFNDIIPLPVPQNVTKTYHHLSSDGSGSIEDLWMEQNLHKRIPFFKKWLSFSNDDTDTNDVKMKQREDDDGDGNQTNRFLSDDDTPTINANEWSNILLEKLNDDTRASSKKEDDYLEAIYSNLNQFIHLLNEGLGILKTKYSNSNNVDDRANDEKYFACSYIKLKQPQQQLKGRGNYSKTSLMLLIARLKIIERVFNNSMNNNGGGTYNLQFDWKNTNTLPWFTEEVFFRFNIT